MCLLNNFGRVGRWRRATVVEEQVAVKTKDLTAAAGPEGPVLEILCYAQTSRPHCKTQRDPAEISRMGDFARICLLRESFDFELHTGSFCRKDQPAS